MSEHKCHAKGCKRECPPRHLMCAPCWDMVPADIQHEVYGTVGRRRKGSPDASWAPWWRAQAKAIDVVRRRAVEAAVAAGRAPHDAIEADSFDRGYRLESDMLFADFLEGKFGERSPGRAAMEDARDTAHAKMEAARTAARARWNEQAEAWASTMRDA